MKNNISDYTELEFLEFTRNIYKSNNEIYPTEDSHIKAVLEFERLTEHPSGSDLLYYPDENREDSPEGIVKEVKEWRAANGLPGFKES
ncbi:TPA: bacteriocin immunity protein [Pseudomonas aeruginosa]|uniref:bacteriocin immunity protein n=1 Tax=Pseudomonas aeruginosa TaxID=287 RepID=UPI0021F226F4|nr:bacteriocin immunity protein [Pseudomonas aeruginosa]MCV4131854.1 bacteriocin immunity protein [Pseudomonas aeruginosa]HCE7029218.1 bacteriocin immunity protein [Pseudomonas aeruginosa]HCK4344343.1 bacteriocin immunity protein [Pseudomonas aeruginosa]